MDLIRQTKLTAAKTRWERMYTKLLAVQKQRDTETRAEEQFRLDDTIADITNALSLIEDEMNELSEPEVATTTSPPPPRSTFPNKPSERPIFISYRRLDLEAVNQIASALEAQGLPIWFDQSSITAGDDWLQIVESNVENCALFLAVLSKNSLVDESEATREWNLAIDRSKKISSQATFLIPILIDDKINDKSPHIPPVFWQKQVIYANGGELTASDIEQIKIKYQLRVER